MKKNRFVFVILFLLAVFITVAVSGRQWTVNYLVNTAKTAEADADLHRISGDKTRGHQKLKESQKYYSLALILDPRNTSILKRLARITQNHRLFSKSLDFSKKAAGIDPKDAEALYLQGLAYWGQKQNGPAESALKAALALKPDYIPARRLLASIVLCDGKPGEAVSLLEANIDPPPGDPESFLLLYEAYQKMGRSDRAVSVLEKALELEKPPIMVYQKLMADYKKMHREDAVDALLKNQLEKYPEDPIEHIKVARHFESGQKLADAEKIYIKAAEIEKSTGRSGAISESNLSGHFHLADFYYRHGRYEEAVGAMEKTLILKPDSQIVYFYLGLYYYDWGKYSKSRMELDRSLALNEISSATLNMLSWLHLTAPKDDPQYDPKRALSLATKAVARQPNHSSYIDTLARAYYAMGRLDESMAAYQKNINAGRNIDLAYYGMAVCSYKKGDFNLGDLYMKKALEAGFRDWRLIRNDQDIHRIRNNRELVRILAENSKGRE